MLLSCSDNANNNDDQGVSAERVAALKAKNKKLHKTAAKKDESLKQFMQAFNEINRNLQIIKQKEDIISMTAGEMPEGVDSDQIQEDILLIYELLQENKETVEKLRANLEKADMVNEEMQASLDILSKTVETKNREIRKYRRKLESRNSELSNLYKQLDSLIAENKEKAKTIKNHEKFLNTGYLVVGTAKDLYEEGVTSKSGGIVGVGSVTKFDDNFERDVFTPVEIDEMQEIPLNCKDARLLSTHPSISYKYEGPPGQIDNLIITRPQKFWSTSRYLVIEVAY